jgi:hypothetical protein
MGRGRVRAQREETKDEKRQLTATVSWSNTEFGIF